MSKLIRSHITECMVIAFLFLTLIVAKCVFGFGKTESETALIIADIATICTYILKIGIDWAIDKYYESKQYVKSVFSSLDHCYEEKKKQQSIEEKIKEIQDKYDHVIIEDGTIRFFEGDQLGDDVITIDCESLLNRAAFLKNLINLPGTSHEIASALLPVVCTIVVAIPSFFVNPQLRNVATLYCAPVMACLLTLIVFGLSTRKMSVKSELINYELSLLGKKISEFQDKSIQQQQIKKEKSNEKQ